MNKLSIFLLALFVFISGCSPIVINPKSADSFNDSIYQSMVKDKVSKNDAEILYKNFIGLSLYLPHSKKIDSTPKLMKTINEFQIEYGYEKGGYSNVTESVRKYLDDKGYLKPKKIVKEVNSETEIHVNTVASDLKGIADNCEKYLKEIKNE